MNAWLRRKADSIVRWVSQYAHLDMLSLYYEMNGILRWRNMHESGEEFFLQGPLRDAIPQSSQIIFDVGANIGEYTAAIRRCYPDSYVHSFEPNPIAFEQLRSRFKEDSNVSCVNLGLSSNSGAVELFDYSGQSGSAHASFYPGVLREIHHEEKLSSVQVRVERLDSYCERGSVDHIDFLKVDTEGNDFSVLKGATRLIAENRLSIIQFEFNEMNVFSRIFLHDFYEFLRGFSFFRLSENRLIDLGSYNSKSEVFKFQNIVAARESIASNWRAKYC